MKKFEVGKFYRTRSGLKAECIALIKNKTFGNIFHVDNKNNEEDYIVSVDRNGHFVFSSNETSDFDIVSEWEVKKKFFKAVYGEKAWRLGEDGFIASTSIWFGNENKYGLAFETKEELEKHMEYIEAVQKLKERIFELNDNEFPEWDWEDEKQEKYHFAKSKGKLTDLFTTTLKCFDNWFYLKTEEARDRLMEEMPEELMIFLSK